MRRRWIAEFWAARKISHHWEESSKDSNAERIQTRRKTWRSPAGHAQQEDGSRKRSLRCCDFQPGSIATRFSVGSYERFVDTARLADKGRSGGTPLRPQQTGTRSSDRSNSNGQKIYAGTILGARGIRRICIPGILIKVENNI
jgi:hypothetical protein